MEVQATVPQCSGVALCFAPVLLGPVSLCHSAFHSRSTGVRTGGSGTPKEWLETREGVWRRESIEAKSKV